MAYGKTPEVDPVLREDRTWLCLGRQLARGNASAHAGQRARDRIGESRERAVASEPGAGDGGRIDQLATE